MPSRFQTGRTRESRGGVHPRMKCLAALGIMLALASGAKALPGPIMVELENLPGCSVQLWDWIDADSEGATWTGQCHEGLAAGTGVLGWKRYAGPLLSGEGTMRDGRPDGRWIVRWAGGRTETGYHNYRSWVRRVGRWIEEWPDGWVAVGAFEANNRKHGPWREESGEKVSTGLYYHSRRHGTWVDRFRDGRVQHCEWRCGTRLRCSPGEPPKGTAALKADWYDRFLRRELRPRLPRYRSPECRGTRPGQPDNGVGSARARTSRATDVDQAAGTRETPREERP